MDILDIILEAKNDKKKTRKPKPQEIKIEPEDDNDDYTEEVDNDEEPDNSDENTDNEDDATDDGVDSSDYTEEEVELDPGEDDEGSDDTDTDPDQDAPTDYTDNTAEEGGDEEGGEGESGGDSEPSDYTDDTGGEGEEGSPDGSEQPEENANEKRILLADMISLLNLAKDTVSKLSTSNKSNILSNKIINQVTKNLTQLVDIVQDFIIHQFSKEKYVKCLYNYNYYVEALKINIKMLKKISDLDTDD